EALAKSRPNSAVDRPFSFTAAFLDARRGQVFAALYDDSRRATEPETVIALEKFLSRAVAISGASPILWKTPDCELLQSLPAWATRKAIGDVIEWIQPPFASQIGAVAYQQFLNGQTTDALALDANYVRRSDAELFWKDHASAASAVKT